MNLPNKKLKDANLEEFSNAMLKGNGIVSESIWIKELFNDQKYIVVEEQVTQYIHNISQFAMSDFFEKQKGFQKEKETFYSDNEETFVVYENLEIEKNKYIRIYKNAYIIYKHPKTKETICVHIERYNEDIMYKIFSSKSQELLSEWINYSKKHNVYKNKKIDANCKFLEIANVSFSDIILPSNIISALRSQIDEYFSYSDYLKSNNISLKRGVILSGEPGTGKTMLCKAISNGIPNTVIYALPRHLENPSDISRVCNMAKDLAPCLLIIEDIDWLAESREVNYNASSVIELMNHLDGMQEFSDVISLATTNNRDKIEKAVSNRPGRFDRVIEIPKPDEKCREEIIKRNSKDWEFSGDIDWKNIIEKTDGLTGSHINDICKTIIFYAIKTKSVNSNKKAIIKQEHLNLAIKEVTNDNISSFNKSAGKTKKVGFN